MATQEPTTNFIRSTKCSLRFATEAKRSKLDEVLQEYGRVCQFFIDHFWEEGLRPKSKFLKNFVDLPLSELDGGTWLTARLRKVAAREAHDMVTAMKKRWGDKAVKPRHPRDRMNVSSTIASLNEPTEKKGGFHFDYWLHLASMGKRTILGFPIKSHEHFKKLDNPEGERKSERKNAYVITSDYVQFSFEIDNSDVEATAPSEAVGVDTGIKKLATLSDGTQLGTEVESYIERIIACQEAGVNQYKARQSLKQYMDKVANEIARRRPEEVVVEDLRGLSQDTKKDRRLNETMRKKVGAWAYAYWLERLRQACEWHGVPFVSVSPAYTSQRCFKCGYTDRSNRKGESFKCGGCGHTADADANAAMNILKRSRGDPEPEGS